MQAPYYQVDAFTDQLFGGNPAGVCLLDKWLRDPMLLNIAAENKHSETAFLVRTKRGYKLRWFTPAKEVDLCGHATLASAFVLFTERDWEGSHIEFQTKNGEFLSAQWYKDEQSVMLDFPARPGKPVEAPRALIEGLRCKPSEVLKSRDYLAVFDTPQEVMRLKPNFELLGKLANTLGIIATAKAEEGSEVDFVLRFFEPRAGVPEDPVTGSAQSTLIPYWAEKLHKKQMVSQQRSVRGGTILCEMREDERVGIGGHAVLYSRGTLILPD